MERNIALDELIRTLPTDGLYTEELLPAAHLLNGHPEPAEALLAEELKAMVDRSDRAATAFREYAERFRNGWSRPPRSRLFRRYCPSGLVERVILGLPRLQVTQAAQQAIAHRN
jgi:hypothetical protein